MDNSFRRTRRPSRQPSAAEAAYRRKQRRARLLRTLQPLFQSAWDAATAARNALNVLAGALEGQEGTVFQQWHTECADDSVRCCDYGQDLREELVRDLRNSAWLINTVVLLNIQSLCPGDCRRSS
jgi:formylglycine-generating enzyme required for sulfatase activity